MHKIMIKDVVFFSHRFPTSLCGFIGLRTRFRRLLPCHGDNTFPRTLAQPCKLVFMALWVMHSQGDPLPRWLLKKQCGFHVTGLLNIFLINNIFVNLKYSIKWIKNMSNTWPLHNLDAHNQKPTILYWSRWWTLPSMLGKNLINHPLQSRTHILK